MCFVFGGSGNLCGEKRSRCAEARRKWCECCDEFSTMCHEEVKTNPRYINVPKMFWSNEPPPPPLNDVNDVTWSIIWSLVILLAGVFYVIVYILGIDEREHKSMGAMTPPSRKSCYNFRVIKINRVVDGDTIDVTIDLGFDLHKKERVRVAGVDT